jgi:undecaprenyl-diphosphatase
VRVIRAYIPWYLAGNYLAFAFVACLGALQVARARRNGTSCAIGITILVGAFLGFYAFAPELLTPGPAGGEMTFLFGGAALLAVVVTRLSSGLGGGARLSARPDRIERSATRTLQSAMILILSFGISLVVVVLDLPLFHALNGLALRTPLIDVPVQFLMNDYMAPTALVLALLALWFAGQDDDERHHFQRTVLRALVALALSSIVLKLINEIYFRPRPFTFDDNVRLLFYHPSDSSMPSNAATVCFALSIAVWLRQRDWGKVMLALGVGMPLARVIGGVHYPADVVAGAWLGGAAAWLVNGMVWLEYPLAAITEIVHRLRLG